MMESVRIKEHVVRPQGVFAHRLDAGAQLAEWIDPEPEPDALVLALPRGGVPVASPLAARLTADLRPVLVRKLAIPANPEMGFGAITLDGTVTLNDDVVRRFGIDRVTVERVAEATRAEVERRSTVYPGGAPLPEMEGRHVWLVDDGLATGFSSLAAAHMIRSHRASRITLAVPCAPDSSVERLSHHVDELWCMYAQSSPPFAVASFYRAFPDMDDAEVVRLLEVGAG